MPRNVPSKVRTSRTKSAEGVTDRRRSERLKGNPLSQVDPKASKDAENFETLHKCLSFNRIKHKKKESKGTAPPARASPRKNPIPPSPSSDDSVDEVDGEEPDYPGRSYVQEVESDDGFRTAHGTDNGAKGDAGADTEEEQGHVTDTEAVHVPPQLLASRATQYLKTAFGKWTREEAKRASARASMLTQSLRETLKADINAAVANALQTQNALFQSTLDDKLANVASLGDLQALTSRVDELSEKLRRVTKQPGRPGSHPTRTVPPMPEGDELDGDQRPDIDHEDLEEGQHRDMTGVDTHVTRSGVPSHLESSRQTYGGYARNSREQGRPSPQDATSSVTMSAMPRNNQPLGPAEYGLDEIEPADDRFRQVLSYRRYRLRDTTSVASGTILRNVGIWQRRLDHVMKRHRFDGKRPVSILNFLASFKTALDTNGVPEIAALIIMPNYLDGEAQVLFKTMMDDAGVQTGFTSWPHAVQFLLETYATDLNLEYAVEALERIRLEPKDTIASFKNRLARAAAEMAGAYPQEALITRFIRNLPSFLKDVVRLELPKVKRNASALNQLAAVAEAYHRTLGSIPSIGKKLRFADPVSAVEEQGDDTLVPGRRSSIANLPPMRSPPTMREMHPMVAAVARQENPSDYAPSTRSDYTPTLEYSERGAEDGAPPDPGVAGFDTVCAVADRPKFPPRRTEQPQQASSFIPLVCFTCFLEGHRSSNCRHRDRIAHDDAFQQWQLGNFNKLQEWQRGWLKSIQRVPLLLRSPHVQQTPRATSEPPKRVLQPQRNVTLQDLDPASLKN